MTDFSIEDDKDAIKTKPSYPDAGVNKPLHTAQHQADSSFLGSGGIRAPLEELGLTPSMERWEKGRGDGEKTWG